MPSGGTRRCGAAARVYRRAQSFHAGRLFVFAGFLKRRALLVGNAGSYFKFCTRKGDRARRLGHSVGFRSRRHGKRQSPKSCGLGYARTAAQARDPPQIRTHGLVQFSGARSARRNGADKSARRRQNREQRRHVDRLYGGKRFFPLSQANAAAR